MFTGPPAASAVISPVALTVATRVLSLVHVSVGLGEQFCTEYDASACVVCPTVSVVSGTVNEIGLTAHGVTASPPTQPARPTPAVMTETAKSKARGVRRCGAGMGMWLLG